MQSCNNQPLLIQSISLMPLNYYYFITLLKLMSQHAKIRKRISFTPIMLTSKSIRPIDRSDHELVRNERKTSSLHKTHNDFSNCILRQSQPFQRSRSPADNNELDREQQDNNDDAKTGSQNFKQLMRKMTTPTVVRVEFNLQTSKKRQKLEQKVKIIRQSDCNEEIKADLNRLLNWSGTKTFEQFGKFTKFKPTKKMRSKNVDELETDWKKYLDRYYLNIKKVTPLLKNQVDNSQLSFENVQSMKEMKEMKEIVQAPKQKTRQSFQNLIRFKSKSPVRSRSKCENRIKPRDTSPLKEQLQKSTEDLTKSFTLKKIQSDILSRKTQARKQFFVFGMSQSAGNRSGEANSKHKFQIYKDFLFRINYTNSLYVFSREETSTSFKFYVGFGNNSAIIKGIMRRRFWWQITDKITEDTNFVWTQLKVSDFFKTQNCNNSNQNQRRRSKYIRLQDNNQQSEQTQIGTQSLMKGDDLISWKNYKSKNLKYEEKGFESVLLRRANSLLKNKVMSIIESPLKLKVQNHFQGNYFLGNKKALFYSLRKYYKLQNIDPFTKIPLTFHITEGLTDPEFQVFLDEFLRQNEKRKIDKQFRNIWIVKPGQLTNRGNGITVCSTLDQIKIRLKAKERNSNGTQRTFIIQKYIQKPLLYHRRKFDIRHYMAVTCINGKMKGYWYAQGYIRTTSCEYNIKNTKDLFTHLTNDAVQKNGQDYGKYQKGNKVSYSDFQKYLTHSLGLDVDFNKGILTKMKELTTDCIKATYLLLDPERKEHNFQLFGLDFMLDESLNVYLIEVNTNPCLQTSCPLLTKIITHLIQNLFKICLDPLFSPPVEWPVQKKYYLGQNTFESNKFCLVFDQSTEGASLQRLYKNANKIDDKMGDIFQQQEEYCDEQKQWSDQQQTKK